MNNKIKCSICGITLLAVAIEGELLFILYHKCNHNLQPHMLEQNYIREFNNLSTDTVISSATGTTFSTHIRNSKV